MEKSNRYSEFIENYDLVALVDIARTEKLTLEIKQELVEALDTTLSFLEYEYSCAKISDIGSDYLEAVETLGDLKGEKDYLGISNYYFFLIELRKNASSAEKQHWFMLLEENINEGLSKFPTDEKFIYNKIHYYKELSKEFNHADTKVVQNLFDLIVKSTKTFPNSDFWTTWLYTLVEFEKVTVSQTSSITNQCIDEFVSLSESLYLSKKLDPIGFYRQLGAYNFLKVLPDKIKAKVEFWIGEAIKSERPLLKGLSNDLLRDQGILFINAFENHHKTKEVIEHAVALNTLSWERFSNWNSLLFFLRSKELYGVYLRQEGDRNQCLAVFASANEVAENVRLTLDLYERNNFSFGSPLLNFYKSFATEVLDEGERVKLTKIRLNVAHATIATGEGSYLFPFEHHLECAAYLSLSEDFKRSWMQMCMVLCRYAHPIFNYWKDHDFIVKNKNLSEFLQKSAFLFSDSWEYNLYNYHKKFPVILHTLSDEELEAEFDRFLNYAKSHKAEKFD